jgi:hypothetical protein
MSCLRVSEDEPAIRRSACRLVGDFMQEFYLLGVGEAHRIGHFIETF